MLFFRILIKFFFLNWCFSGVVEWGRRGCDRMVVGLKTTYAISGYHHYHCEFAFH
jgi:hypothetical protein